MLIYFSVVGKNVLGQAETGSGKTGAFALPILQVGFAPVLVIFNPNFVVEIKRRSIFFFCCDSHANKVLFLVNLHFLSQFIFLGTESSLSKLLNK